MTARPATSASPVVSRRRHRVSRGTHLDAAHADLRSSAGVSSGAPSQRPGTSCCRSRFTERLVGNLAGPAHPRDRSLGMIAELLRYPFGTATLAECVDSRGNGLPDFRGTGMVSALQCRHEQGIGVDGANTEVVHRWPHHEPPRPLAPLTTSPGPGTLDLYLAEHPGRLVIPASRKNARGLQNSWCPSARFNGSTSGPTPGRSPGQRQLRTFTPSEAMYKHTARPTAGEPGITGTAMQPATRRALDYRANPPYLKPSLVVTLAIGNAPELSICGSLPRPWVQGFAKVSVTVSG